MEAKSATSPFALIQMGEEAAEEALLPLHHLLPLLNAKLMVCHAVVILLCAAMDVLVGRSRIVCASK